MTEQPRHYLRTIHVDHFGAFTDRTVGPFSPGLNVVYGPNESGKTTTAAFIGGVLFGWPDARATRNVYRPAGAERAGTLIFASRDGGDEVSCTRERNAEGIKPDPAPSVLSDIDRDTFRTIFSLDADELRSMGRTTDVTTQLLTAGSGTQVSPAQVSAKLDERLAGMMSRASSYPDSVSNLQTKLVQTRDAMNAARAQVVALEQEDREYTRLKAKRAQLANQTAQLNEEIRSLTSEREKLSAVVLRQEQIQDDLEKLDEQQARLDAERKAVDAHRSPRYLAIDAVEERTLRDAIEDMAEEQRQQEQALSIAERDLLTSQATLEALREKDDERALRGGTVRKRTVQSVLSVVFPLLFAVLGVLVFVRGRAISSLSVTALGVALLVFAVLMACAALAMLLKPDRAQERLREQLADAEFVVQKDIKKKEACEQALAAQARKREEFLAAAGLGAAEGSLRRARALLDESSDARAEETLFDQRARAIALQRAQLRRTSRLVDGEKHQVLAALGEPDDLTVTQLDERLAEKVAQRDEQLQTTASVNERLGELSTILNEARSAKDFDSAKLAHAQVKSRLDDAYEELVRLLLAKRLLEAAIEVWEGKSQPAVYQRASELFADMTDGTWTQVRLTAAGTLVVMDDDGQTRAPELLSLGTCQQLYLAMRIALLMTAENVGRSIPVLADDILVNFDTTRRAGAARSLATLARTRQVILFTCHEEVLDLIRGTDSTANVMML